MTVITPQQAARFFAERLALQTDVADVQAAEPGTFTLIDARSKAAWEQGHIPGAIHLPHAEISAGDRAEISGTGGNGGRLDPALPVVAYCWGPGCNGATRAALALSLRGYRAKEMIGGIEYWIREGFPVTGATGDVVREPDQLTTVCGC